MCGSSGGSSFKPYNLRVKLMKASIVDAVGFRLFVLTFCLQQTGSHCLSYY